MGFAVPYQFVGREEMSENEQQIDSIFKEMESFLKSQAREEPIPSQPLYLRTEYKTSLKLTDSEKNVFPVEESFLSAFRETYTDKAFKVVRLHNWEFELQFVGKKCNKISLISDNVVFIANKNNRKEITGCHFKIAIVEDEAEIAKLSPELNGYLNRLGKRSLCEYSNNVAPEMKSLISFATLKPTSVPSFNYKPYARQDYEQIDPLSTLNPDGRKIVEKLRHFITRQQIYDFILEQEVSEEAALELRKLTAVGGEKRA